MFAIKIASKSAINPSYDLEEAKMARYKKYCYDQGKLLSVHFHKQIVEGTFEYTLSYLIDNEVDLTPFDSKYNNDDTGAPACNPAILLKIILFAYSRGIISSRKIAQACEENIIFMALSAQQLLDDEKHQVIVHTQAFGEAQEHGLLQPVIEGTHDILTDIGERNDVFKKTKLTADAGFHDEANMKLRGLIKLNRGSDKQPHTTAT